MKFTKTFALTFCLIGISNAMSVRLLATDAIAQDAATQKSAVSRVNDRVELRSGSDIDVRLIDQMKTENRSFVIFET